MDYHHTPPAFTQQDPTFRRLTSEYPSTSYSALQLPSPLPSDIAPDADPFASSLYPSTGVIDSLSMISICLRRSAHIPRAYQIFKNLIEDSKTGMRRTPDAEVWGRVIQGVASLGKRGDSSDETWKQWRTRAEVLVNQWEAANNVFKGSPALKNNGIKVYQGWLSGMIRWVRLRIKLTIVLQHLWTTFSHIFVGQTFHSPPCSPVWNRPSCHSHTRHYSP